MRKVLHYLWAAIIAFLEAGPVYPVLRHDQHPASVASSLPRTLARWRNQS